MKNDINFLYEIGSLRNTQRGWRQHLGMECGNVNDHTVRVIWLAILICRMEKSGDENKILRMALAHDIPETRTSDLSYVQKAYVKPDDDSAAKDALLDTTLADFYTDILSEYEEREGIESKIVKDADNLDVDLELKELEERGSLLPQKWKDFRRSMRDEQLYTDSSKKLWDEIQKSDVAEWHMKSNKLIKK